MKVTDQSKSIIYFRNVDAGIDGQGWNKKPVHIEREVGVTMGVMILPGVDACPS